MDAGVPNDLSETTIYPKFSYIMNILYFIITTDRCRLTRWMSFGAQTDVSTRRMSSHILTDVVSHTDRCRLTQIKIVISKSIVIPYFIEFQVSDIPSGAPDDGDGDECCLWPTLARKF